MSKKLIENILYRDANCLVVNKPAGVAVHKGTGKGPNLEEDLKDLCFGLPNIPQLAHRLDAATSGCLVLGRHRKALAHLGRLFQNNFIQKQYWAIVEGIPDQKQGTIDLPLVKQNDRSHHWWMKVDHEKGQTAITHYQVLHTFDARYAFLILTPVTGRTHQLRVHTDACGFPILGDGIYNRSSLYKGRHDQKLHLHARYLSIPYHMKKPSIDVYAPLPDHMVDTLNSLGLSPDDFTDLEAMIHYVDPLTEKL